MIAVLIGLVVVLVVIRVAAWFNLPNPRCVCGIKHLGYRAAAGKCPQHGEPSLTQPQRLPLRQPPTPITPSEARIEQSAWAVGCGEKTLADHERDVAKWLLEADQAKPPKATPKSRKPPENPIFDPQSRVAYRPLDLDIETR